MRLLSRKFTAYYFHKVVVLNYRRYTTGLSYLLIFAFSSPPVQQDSFKKKNHCSASRGRFSIKSAFCVEKSMDRCEL